MIGCVICKLGPEQGISLFRINEKGVPGLYACRKHVHQTDADLDPEVVALFNILDPPSRVERALFAEDDANA